jgi:hypothetical protein
MTEENVSEENTSEGHAPPLVAYTRSAWRPVAVGTAERAVAGLTRRYEGMVARPVDVLAWPATLRGRVERRSGPGRPADHPMTGHRWTSPGPAAPAVLTGRSAADRRDGPVMEPEATPAPDAGGEAGDTAVPVPGVTAPRTGPPSPGVRTARATPVSPPVRTVRVAPASPLSPAAAHTEATTVRKPETEETGAGTAEAGDREARGGGASERRTPGPSPLWAPDIATTDLLGTLFDALTVPREMPEFTMRVAEEPRTDGPPAPETPGTPPGPASPAAAGDVRARRLSGDPTAGRPDRASPASPGDGRPPPTEAQAPWPRAVAYTDRPPGLRASEIRQVADRVGEALLRRQEIERERNGG